MWIGSESERKTLAPLHSFIHSFLQAHGRGTVRGQMDRLHGISRVDRVAELRPLPLGEELQGDEGSVAAHSRVVPRVDHVLVAAVLPEPGSAERALKLCCRRRAPDGEKLRTVTETNQ